MKSKSGDALSLIVKGQGKHPAYNIVMARDDAADLKYRQMTEYRDANPILPCLNPYVLSGVGLPSVLDVGKSKILVDIPTRCRQCDNCLRHRRRLWTARAVDELKCSSRTWFGTLTYHPEARFAHQLRAADGASAANLGNQRSSNDATMFRALAASTGPDVTAWLKRVRKQSGTKLRYLLVCEAHEDGFPHYHILLHEPALPVTKRLLEEQWKFGFSHWRLVKKMDPRSAYYACKYLAKDARTRVRASVRYGQPQLIGAYTEVMEKAATDARKRKTNPVQTQTARD